MIQRSGKVPGKKLECPYSAKVLTQLLTALRYRRGNEVLQIQIQTIGN